MRQKKEDEQLCPLSFNVHSDMFKGTCLTAGTDTVAMYQRAIVPFKVSDFQLSKPLNYAQCSGHLLYSE